MGKTTKSGLALTTAQLAARVAGATPKQTGGPQLVQEDPFPTKVRKQTKKAKDGPSHWKGMTLAQRRLALLRHQTRPSLTAGNSVPGTKKYRKKEAITKSELRHLAHHAQETQAEEIPLPPPLASDMEEDRAFAELGGSLFHPVGPHEGAGPDAPALARLAFQERKSYLFFDNMAILRTQSQAQGDELKGLTEEVETSRARMARLEEGQRNTHSLMAEVKSLLKQSAADNAAASTAHTTALSGLNARLTSQEKEQKGMQSCIDKLRHIVELSHSSTTTKGKATPTTTKVGLPTNQQAALPALGTDSWAEDPIEAAPPEDPEKAAREDFFATKAVEISSLRTAIDSDWNCLIEQDTLQKLKEEQIHWEAHYSTAILLHDSMEAHSRKWGGDPQHGALLKDIEMAIRKVVDTKKKLTHCVAKEEAAALEAALPPFMKYNQPPPPPPAQEGPYMAAVRATPPIPLDLEGAARAQAATRATGRLSNDNGASHAEEVFGVSERGRGLTHHPLGGSKIPMVPLPTKYSGSLSEDLDTSMFAFETYLEGNNIPRDMWPKHAMQLLTGKALEAYMAVALPMQKEGQHPTWDKFKGTLYSSFVTHDKMMEARAALLTCTQSHSVPAYLQQFRMLIAKAGQPQPTDKDLLLLYWKGLKQEVREAAKLNPKTGAFWETFEELAQHTSVLARQHTLSLPHLHPHGNNREQGRHNKWLKAKLRATAVRKITKTKLKIVATPKPHGQDNRPTHGNGKDYTGPPPAGGGRSAYGRGQGAGGRFSGVPRPRPPNCPQCKGGVSGAGDVYHTANCPVHIQNILKQYGNK